MKRDNDGQAGHVPAAWKRRAWNSQIEAATDVPTPGTVLSTHVRHRCQYMEPNTTQMWAYWDRIAIAGTNVAKAIGMNPFADGDPLALFNLLRKYTERTPMDEEQTKRVEHGIQNESHARQLYARLMGNIEITQHDRTIDAAHSWIAYGCDGHARGLPNHTARTGKPLDYMLEIKCPMGRPYESIPVHYMIQIQTGLALHHMPWCDFVMYTQRTVVGDGTRPSRIVDHLTVWRVMFSPTCWLEILDRLTYFVHCLDNDVPPLPDFLLNSAAHKDLFESPKINVRKIIDQDVEPDAAEPPPLPL